MKVQETLPSFMVILPSKHKSTSISHVQIFLMILFSKSESTKGLLLPTLPGSFNGHDALVFQLFWSLKFHCFRSRWQQKAPNIFTKWAYGLNLLHPQKDVAEMASVFRSCYKLRSTSMPLLSQIHGLDEFWVLDERFPHKFGLISIKQYHLNTY